MSEDLDAVQVAVLVARAIERVGGRYFVGGSLASSIDGEPRATNDIDIVLDLPIGRVAELRGALGAQFELDEDMLRDALLRGSYANAFYLPLVMKVDFFGHARGDFDVSEFERRRSVNVDAEGTTLYVKSPEDTVLRKLLWYRDGGAVSEKQWRDVVGVIRHASGALDDGYLDRWAAKLGVAELLGRARRDARE